MEDLIRVLTPLPVLLPLLVRRPALLVGRHPQTSGCCRSRCSRACWPSRSRCWCSPTTRAPPRCRRWLAGAAGHRAGGRPAVRADAGGRQHRHPRRAGVRGRAGCRDGEETDTPLSIFHPTYLVLVAGVSNAFLAGDLFNLYVGFEVLLAASYVLLTLGGTAGRIRAGITYVVVSLMSSLVFLAAIALVYAATGTVNMAQLAVRLGELPGHAAAAAVDAAGRLRHQGRGLPAVVLAARQLPDRTRAGHRAVFAGLLTRSASTRSSAPTRCCSPTGRWTTC